MAGNKRGSGPKGTQGGCPDCRPGAPNARACDQSHVSTRVRQRERQVDLAAPLRTLRQLGTDDSPGRVTRIRQPRSDSATPIRPPCRSTAQRAIASPSPVPPSLPGPCGELTPPRLNRSKTRCHSERGMPGPSSRISSSSDSASSPRRAFTVTRPCAGLCLTALSIRLATTWWRRSGSACAISSGGLTSRCRWTSVRV